jgi:hypothetical protein
MFAIPMVSRDSGDVDKTKAGGSQRLCDRENMGWGGIVIDDWDQPLAHEDSEFRVTACEMLVRRMIIEKDIY